MNIWSEETLAAMQRCAFDVASDKQQAALERFLRAEKPSRHVESWKYTNFNELDKKSIDSLCSPRITKNACLSSPAPLAVEGSHHLVFIDGIFDKTNSTVKTLPVGVVLTNLESVIKEKKYQDLIWQQDQHLTLFSDLNDAMLNDGLFLYIPKNTVLEKPIHLLYINTEETIQHPRHLILLEENSEVKMLEEYVGDKGAYFNNVKTQIIVRENARLEHYKLQRQSESSFHIANISIQQAKNSSVKTYHFGIGAKLGREDCHYDLKAEGTDSELVGFYHAKGLRHLDAHTRVDHAFSHAHSNQCYKAIAADKGTAVFNGKIMVHAGSEKVAAHQQNRNLLLDKTATIDAKPELEIYSDDVKCSHGATVGQLDEKALFYLRSRGIPDKEAKLLLMQAFVDDVFNRMPENALSCHIIKYVNLEFLPEVNHA